MNIDIEAGRLKEFVAVANKFANEANLKVSKDGLEASSVDPSHVVMTYAKLDPASISMTGVDEITMPCDLNKLTQILTLPGKDDTVSMSVNKGRLTLKFGNLKRSTALLDPGCISEPKMPNIRLEETVTIPIDEIKGVASSGDDIEGAVEFILTPDNFTAKSKNDNDEIELKVSKDGAPQYSCKEAVHSKISSDMFNMALRGVKGNIKFNLNTDYPVKIEYGFAGGMGTAWHLIAPRIESE